MAGWFRVGGNFYRDDGRAPLPEGAVAVARGPREGERWDEKEGGFVVDEAWKAQRRKERRRRDPEVFASLEARVERLEEELAKLKELR